VKVDELPIYSKTEREERGKEKIVGENNKEKKQTFAHSE
jgi:hypothetical protein